MARIRTVKPDFFVHEGLAELSLGHRLLFLGLWTLADRVGRLQDRPRRIKAAIFPYDDALTPPKINEMLDDLQNHPEAFLIRYAQGSVGCIQINAFLRHQRPTEREPDSELPAPPNWDAVPAARKSPSAADLLRSMLRDGPQLAADIRAEATRRGISERTLGRARLQLGVDSQPVSGDRRRKLWSESTSQSTGQVPAEYQSIPAKVPDTISALEEKLNKDGQEEYRQKYRPIPVKHAGKGREVVRVNALLPTKGKEKESSESRSAPVLSRAEIESIFGLAGSRQVDN